MTRKIVALVGAGGVGKTSLIPFFERAGYVKFPSISRDYYASQGLENEDAYLHLIPEDRAKFQLGMQAYYRERFSAFIKDVPEQLDVITDRSVIDHMAYCIHGTPAVQDVQTLVDNCIDYTNSTYTHLVYLPFPQPWMKTTSIEDGFRNTDQNKNFAVSSIMLATLEWNTTRTGKLKIPIILESEDLPPERKAKRLMYRIGLGC